MEGGNAHGRNLLKFYAVVRLIQDTLSEMVSRQHRRRDTDAEMLLCSFTVDIDTVQQRALKAVLSEDCLVFARCHQRSALSAEA